MRVLTERRIEAGWAIQWVAMAGVLFVASAIAHGAAYVFFGLSACDSDGLGPIPGSSMRSRICGLDPRYGSLEWLPRTVFGVSLLVVPVVILAAIAWRSRAGWLAVPLLVIAPAVEWWILAAGTGNY